MAATRWVQELLEPNKATYPLMSESGADYSWDGLSEDLKEALIGFMAVYDLAEISFAGVTSQLQVFGRIGMARATDIIDMARNGSLYRPTTNKEMSDNKKVCFMISQRSCRSLLFRQTSVQECRCPGPPAQQIAF